MLKRNAVKGNCPMPPVIRKIRTTGKKGKIRFKKIC